MAEETLQVTEWMADFIEWTNAQGEETIRNMVREHLAEIKKQNEISQDSHVDEGFKWDDALEPNDGADQWKHGGDCTLCRKINYCGTRCRANKLLKKISTPFLYNQYITGNPEAAAKQISGIDPEKLLKQLGVIS